MRTCTTTIQPPQPHGVLAQTPLLGRKQWQDPSRHMCPGAFSQRTVHPLDLVGCQASNAAPHAVQRCVAAHPCQVIARVAACPVRQNSVVHIIRHLHILPPGTQAGRRSVWKMIPCAPLVAGGKQAGREQSVLPQTESARSEAHTERAQPMLSGIGALPLRSRAAAQVGQTMPSGPAPPGLHLGM